MKLAVVLRGITFFRSLGTIIYFARQFPVLELFVFIQGNRRGKEYDSLDPDHVADFAPYATVVSFVDDDDLTHHLRRLEIRAVLTQDPSHQFPSLFALSSLSVYGISVFIDSLHYAWRVRLGDAPKLVPRKLYFPCQYIEEKFFALGSFSRSELAYATLGSPLFDHSLFVSPHSASYPTLLFITPPPLLFSLPMKWRVARLFGSARDRGYRVIAKDRVKTPLSSWLRRHCDEVHTNETLLPYASLGLLAAVTVHVCGWSTSIFEARFFNKPTLNLDLPLRRFTLGNFVQHYGLSDLYSSATSITASQGLTTAFTRLLQLPSDMFAENDRFVGPATQPTMTDNASVRILRDILSCEDSHA